MHELSIAKSILNTVLKVSKKKKIKEIKKINLVIGDLSSVIDESFTYYFSLISKDTVAKKANIYIKRVPAIAKCTECKKSFASTIPFEAICKYCKSNKITIDGGRELFIESIET